MRSKFEFIRGDIEGNRKKWVAALRSGLWKQGTEYLCCNDKYCCLGVAASLTPHKGKGHRVLKTGVVDYWGNKRSCPKQTMEQLGISTTLGFYQVRKNGYSNLVNLNDEKCLTFKEIADVIELEPKGLFND